MYIKIFTKLTEIPRHRIMTCIKFQGSMGGLRLPGYKISVTIYELDKIGIIKLNTMTSLRLTAIESHHCVTCVNSLCNLCT